MDDLRTALDAALAPGIAEDAIEHASQVVASAAALYEAFRRAGPQATLVGGSAIEVHAPGVLKSGDIDLVIEALQVERPRERIADIFGALGFEPSGRHWRRGDLFVEVPSLSLSDPAELVRVGPLVFGVVTKEVLLACQRSCDHSTRSRQSEPWPSRPSLSRTSGCRRSWMT